MLNEDFLRRIDNPKSKELQSLLKKARKYCKENLEEEDVKFPEKDMEKLTSTFYYNAKEDKNPRYIFLVQNPGALQRDRHFGDEISDIRKSETHEERIQVYRKYLKKWLLKKNEDFSKEFFIILEEENFIDFEIDWKDYIKNGEVFRDFYFTDLVKYRVKTDDVKEKVGDNGDISFEDFLKKEIEFISPSLIFVFGRRAWKVLKRKTNPDFVSGNEIDSKASNITDVHGYLFETKKVFDTYLLPLSHFSGQNQFLRNSYFDYLKEGLVKFP